MEKKLALTSERISWTCNTDLNGRLRAFPNVRYTSFFHLYIQETEDQKYQIIISCSLLDGLTWSPQEGGQFERITLTEDRILLITRPSKSLRLTKHCARSYILEGGQYAFRKGIPKTERNYVL